MSSQVQRARRALTESEWLTSPDLWAMLNHVSGGASERQLRLFACACCRRVWHLLTEERCRRAVTASERFADGLAGREDLVPLGPGVRYAPSETRAALLTGWAPRPEGAWLMAWHIAGEVVAAVWADAPWDEDLRARIAARDHERLRQCDLLRDIVGNPFRPTEVNPTWRSWNNGCVPELARVIAREQDFSAGLPILADALADAGCTSADILTHCRSSGEHVRGCWVVDLILSKDR